MYRVASVLVVVVVLVLFLSAPVLAVDPANTHIGTVVSVAGNKLIMKAEGKQHTHVLAANATVTCDGKECKLTDLTPGMKVRVTTDRDDPKTALRVEALKKKKTFDRTDKDRQNKAADRKRLRRRLAHLASGVGARPPVHLSHGLRPRLPSGRCLSTMTGKSAHSSRGMRNSPYTLSPSLS